MKQPISLFSLAGLIVMMSLQLSGCGFDEHLESQPSDAYQPVKKSSSAPNQHAPAKVTLPKSQLSGLYAANGATGTFPDYSYLRFYPDGAVIYVESSGPPKEWAKKSGQQFNRNTAKTSDYVYEGRYSIKAGQIQFAVKSSDFGTMVFEGAIKKGELHLKVSGNEYADNRKMPGNPNGKPWVFKPLPQ